jgi:hypothetical protein
MGLEPRLARALVKWAKGSGLARASISGARSTTTLNVLLSLSVSLSLFPFSPPPRIREDESLSSPFVPDSTGVDMDPSFFLSFFRMQC